MTETVEGFVGGSAVGATLIVAEVRPERDHPLPATTGIPFPRGRWDGIEPPRLHSRGRVLESSHRIVERWSDGSVRWALFDMRIPVEAASGDRIELRFAAQPEESDTGSTHGTGVRVEESTAGCIIDTGAARFHLARGTSFPFAGVDAGGRALIGDGDGSFVAQDAKGLLYPARIRRIELEAANPLRATARLEGALEPAAGGPPLLVFVARAHFFKGIASVRIHVTVRNPRRAAHPGGHWELGDEGSVLLRDLTMQLDSLGRNRIKWTTEPEHPPQDRADATLEIVQDSSGGENWRSRVHLDRDRRVASTFRGYRERVDGTERPGLRASPWAAIHDGEVGLSMAPRWFWQDFPKAIEASPGSIALRFFPQQFGSLHEIQGGEQKTHEVVVGFAAEALAPERGLPAHPSLVHPSPDTFASSGAIPYLVSRPPGTPTLHDRLVDQALEGPDTFESKRERVDEYGWRHFGELWADHEARFHEGKEAFVSHYNNQYDVVYGAFLQFARTGDPRWHRIHEELARHVIDIDIYHTSEDKAAYNQGLFWHTVHYVDADLSTHRSYPRRGSHGGGPDNEHNYTSGLHLRALLSGDALARETVLASARWVIDADDGARTILKWIDRGRTGLATKTRDFHYHGPGRGAGNSLNALMDAWRLTREDRFLAKAREVIRRTVHPQDDVPARDLLDAENRWSYTVFLQALGMYLDVMDETGRLDEDFAYARASLLAYARWMVAHERPILDTPERLEYPTETWAAQDLRKTDVLLFAALHSDGDERRAFLERARFFFHHSLESLDRFPTKSCARAVILVMRFGMMHFWFESNPGATRSRGPAVADFGRPSLFVPQKTRAVARLKGLAAVGVAVAAVAVALLARSFVR